MRRSRSSSSGSSPRWSRGGGYSSGRRDRVAADALRPRCHGDRGLAGDAPRRNGRPAWGWRSRSVREPGSHCSSGPGCSSRSPPIGDPSLVTWRGLSGGGRGARPGGPRPVVAGLGPGGGDLPIGDSSSGRCGGRRSVPAAPPSRCWCCTCSGTCRHDRFRSWPARWWAARSGSARVVVGRARGAPREPYPLDRTDARASPEGRAGGAA